MNEIKEKNPEGAFIAPSLPYSHPNPQGEQKERSHGAIHTFHGESYPQGVEKLWIT